MYLKITIKFEMKKKKEHLQKITFAKNKIFNKDEINLMHV